MTRLRPNLNFRVTSQKWSSFSQISLKKRWMNSLKVDKTNHTNKHPLLYTEKQEPPLHKQNEKKNALILDFLFCFYSTPEEKKRFKTLVETSLKI